MERDKVAIIGVSGQRIGKAVAVALGRDSAEELTRELINMCPSPTMKVHFANGEVVQMNRAERRRRHLYGDRLTIRKRRPSPPFVFHSPEEMRDAQLGDNHV